MSLKLLILALLVIFSLSARNMRMGNKAVAKAGGYLGDSLVSFINMFRSKPQPLPKNYKRQYQRPVKEESTLWYKFKNGLKNFLYLGYLLAIVGVGLVAIKIYNWALKIYYKYKISSLPQNQLRELRYYKKELQKLQPVQNKTKLSKQTSQQKLEENLKSLGF